MADSSFQLGQHEAQIQTLVSDVGDMKRDISWIREHLAEKKGERRVAIWIAGSSSGVVVTIAAFIARHFKL